MPSKSNGPRPASVDPMLPTAVISAGGKKYTVSLDIGTLIDAEEELIARGHDVSLLQVMPPMIASQVRVLFALATRRHHPELPYEQAFTTLNADLEALKHAQALFCGLYVASMPQTAKEAGIDVGPTQPAGSEE